MGAKHNTVEQVRVKNQPKLFAKNSHQSIISKNSGRLPSTTLRTGAGVSGFSAREWKPGGEKPGHQRVAGGRSVPPTRHGGQAAGAGASMGIVKSY